MSELEKSEPQREIRWCKKAKYYDRATPPGFFCIDKETCPYRSAEYRCTMHCKLHPKY